MNPSFESDPLQLHAAVDGSFIGAAGGIGTYSWKLIEALIPRRDELRLTLIENELPSHIPQYQRQTETREIRLPAFPPHWDSISTRIRNRTRWLLLTLPGVLKQCRPHVYHALDSVSVPLWGCRLPTVVTVHDIIPITHPQYCRTKDALGARILIPLAMRNAQAVITDSRYSADQIRDRYPALADKLHTIPCGVDSDFFSPPEDREVLSRECASRWNLPSPVFLLTVVTLNPRRNLLRLLQAFEQYAESSGEKDVCLVVAGCQGWKDEEILRCGRNMKHGDRVSFLGRVTDEELRRLYQSAGAFAFPSLLEGFGLPVLEAMACGTPVICSSTSSVGEVAGEAALCFDPLDSLEIQESIRRVFADSTLRKDLSLYGRKRALQFPWSETARWTLAVYRQVCRSGSRPS